MNEAEIVKSSDCKVLFLHGLESGIHGSKAMYLVKHFDKTVIPDLQTGSWNFNTNSFLLSAFRNIHRVFLGDFYSSITRDVLSRGADLACTSYTAEKPDIVVASSMGGAIALEGIRRGIITAPTLLIAPALKRVVRGDLTAAGGGDAEDAAMKEWYASYHSNRTESLDRDSATIVATSTSSSSSSSSSTPTTVRRKINSRIVIVHGALDSTVPLKDSRELSAAIGAELIVVEDGDHRLNDFLLDGFSTEPELATNESGAPGEQQQQQQQQHKPRQNKLIDLVRDLLVKQN